MDLLLWRHAQAEDGGQWRDDMRRALTAKGREQARRMAAWLDRQLPKDTLILCSPALRCQQTVQALKRKYSLCSELAPDAATPNALLTAAGWPRCDATVLLVGHQPTLGQVIAQLTGLHPSCPVRKGALWWLRDHQHSGAAQAVIFSVQSPDMLYPENGS